MTVALAATAIVVLALLFEVSLPWLHPRFARPRPAPRPRGRRPRAALRGVAPVARPALRAPPRRARGAPPRRAGAVRPRARPARRAEGPRACGPLRQRRGVGDVPRPPLHPGLGRPGRRAGLRSAVVARPARRPLR